MFTYNKWHYGIPGERDASVGGKLEVLGRVADAEFEVIEPTTEQQDEHRDESAGDGTGYPAAPSGEDRGEFYIARKG